ncbi:MAG: arsenite efflux transporter metallochaperone ArsD [Elusimicrobia bacterium]|nr:arsenite efflux transporter metallochaperone ArsD [Elusimicrobiota bacterium]
MKKIEVFDPAMCCSSGVCGPSVDPLLSRFSADLDWLSGRRVRVTRYNLSQEPKAFAANALVSVVLKKEGPKSLPIIVADGNIVSKKKYPSRSQLAAWAGVTLAGSKPMVSAASCCSPKKTPKGRVVKGCC